MGKRRKSAMEMRAVRIKLKAGAIGDTRQWAAEIKRHREEALDALRAEDMALECYFLERAADGEYLIAIMAAKDFDHTQQVAAASPRPIDSYHQTFKQKCWGAVQALEPLLILDRSGEMEEA